MVCHEDNLSTTHRALLRGLERFYDIDISTHFLFGLLNPQVAPGTQEISQRLLWRSRRSLTG